MDLVVDANVIFAALIKEGKTHELIFDEKLHLFTTEFFFTEFEKHAKELRDRFGFEIEMRNLESRQSAEGKAEKSAGLFY